MTCLVRLPAGFVFIYPRSSTLSKLANNRLKKCFYVIFGGLVVLTWFITYQCYQCEDLEQYLGFTNEALRRCHCDGVLYTYFGITLECFIIEMIAWRPWNNLVKKSSWRSIVYLPAWGIELALILPAILNISLYLLFLLLLNTLDMYSFNLAIGVYENTDNRLILYYNSIIITLLLIYSTKSWRAMVDDSTSKNPTTRFTERKSIKQLTQRLKRRKRCNQTFKIILLQSRKITFVTKDEIL